MKRKRAAILALLAAASVVACGDEPPALEDGPQAAALRLFTIVDTDLDAPDVSDRVGEVVVLDGGDVPSLLDALESMRGVGRVRVVEAEAIEDDGRWIVDIEGELPGPSLATYGVETVDTPVGWRVVWFHGPGVEWPGRPSRRDPSLTTSHPPGDGD